ncbi:type VI secretion system Vgr family protein [Xanthomonas oryzae]|uniref:type VI secretion system Vgr family protein n=1 Tax=Xanthomonas oryzae TaxID=347 RepID=UPI000949C4D9|nr:type VI secretion system Vgr family protein [Xanthomonas oryzae]AXQ10496.1 type VI secretion protein [Xanthomonas oryzae pv. oryzae]AXQ76427.1 type VI secretion protein [Xanthomonas oryzae pv. oryzae]QIE14995.1 type VI secretion system tip protein VgrG [Xanthomonas oryzae pv. oryzae]QQD50445.1 type VI secretion system tip protein VgrG [Xanthomonas oryzae pv. oryzae]UUC39715.1 type VI secretion system tip protein TssI/VgrG [Xanthomonas oryzae pv. oryzae]
MDLMQYVAISQDGRTLELQFAGQNAPHPNLLFPLRLQLTWALSEPFTADVTCLSQSSAIELKTLLGQRAGITIRHHDGERKVNGVVTAVRQLGADGGLSSYRLRIQPALALLAYRRTCRIFKEESVPDIVAQIVQEHRASNPPIAASFRLDQQLRQTYAPRSYCTQFDEDDLGFIHRVLAEEGINYTFVFADDQGAPTHTLVLFDDVNDLAQASPARIGYRRAEDATPADSLLAWQGERQVMTSATTLVSYDYKPAASSNADDRSVIYQGEEGRAASATLRDYSALSPYYASDSAEYARYAQVRQTWHDQRAKTWYGGATTPGLEVGTYVEIADHPSLAQDSSEQRQFVVTEQFLDITNNLPADMTRQLPSGLLGLSSADVSPPPSLAAVPPPPAGAAQYLRFAGVRRGVALVPSRVPSLRRPTASGPQTATVVGKAGEVVDTDELGRILVQMHWPLAQEHAKGGANDDERSSTRVRYASPSASEGFGHQFIPRVGDEVLIEFLHGDIDRPIAVAVIHNGRRPTAAFSGARGLPGNRTLSGILTREHNGSGANELLFDDTTGQPRARLASTHQASELNLGYLTHPRADGQADPRGQGAELRTDAAAALRAAQGMLLTTYARSQAAGHQLDRGELDALLAQCLELFKGLGDYAAQHGGQAVETGGQDALRQALQGWPSGTERSAAGKPLMAFAASEGMVSATPHSHLSYAGHNIDSLAQQHLQLTSGQSTRVHAGQGIALFAQASGLSAIANQGPVHLQAQADALVANAQTNLQLTANTGEVLLSAPRIRLVAEDGSFLSIGGGGITLGTQGGVELHAASHALLGPSTEQADRPGFGKDGTDQKFQLHYPSHSADTPQLAANQPYSITLDDGRVVQGVSDANGLTDLLRDEVTRIARIEVHKPPLGGG